MESIRDKTILFDARHISNQYSGLGRYTFSILVTLLFKSSLYKKLKIILQKDSDDLNTLSIKELVKTNSSVELIEVKSKNFSLAHHILLPLKLLFIKHELYFYPHFDLPSFYFKKSIFVIHDLKYLKLENQISSFIKPKKFLFKNIIRFNIYKRNTTCICVSNSTRNDVKEIINNKLYSKLKVVYEDTFIKELSNLEVRPTIKNIIEQFPKFLFYIGDRRPHKNLKKTINIINILNQELNYPCTFVIAGSENNFDFNLDEYILENENVMAIGTVNDKELELLYENMSALLYLSKYEGFGLPILEAAKYNKKIVTSNISSIPEVCPASALMLDINQDEYILAKHIFEYLKCENIDLNHKEHLSKFSWSNSVDEIFR